MPGSIDGSLTVTLGGTANYSLPIRGVPGTAGTEPKLSVNYDSQAPGGPLGAGWSLSGLSIITRGPKSIRSDGSVDGVRMQITDALYLDGKRLVLVASSGSGSSRRAEYKKELEDQSRITQYGEDDGIGHIVVETKAGLRMEYGSTSDSRILLNAGRALLLANSRITDSAGNYINFIYTQSGSGDYDIASIEYTGNDSDSHNILLPYAKVVFSYSQASRTIESFIAGAAVVRKSRLESITTTLQNSGSPAEEIFKYRFTYKDAPTTANRFLLDSISVVGRGGEALPSTFFSYSQPAIGWRQASTYDLPFAIAGKQHTSLGYRLADFSGDKLPDLIFGYSTDGQLENFAFKNDGAGWVREDKFKPPIALARGRSGRGVYIVDVNGTGGDDLLETTTSGPGGKRAFLAGPNGWVESSAYSLPADYEEPEEIVDSTNKSRLIFGHFSNKTLDDVVWRGQTTSGYQINSGSGWSTGPPPPVTIDEFTRAVDVDCDGLTELVARTSTGPDWQWQVYRFKSGAWIEETDAKYRYPIPSNSPLDAVLDLPGLSGDCHLALFSEAGHPDTRTAWRASATGWTTEQSTKPIFDLSGPSGLKQDAMVYDLDGDGHSDIMGYGEGRPAFAFLQSNSGWQSRTGFAPPRPLTDKPVLIGDLNGDKDVELLFPSDSRAAFGDAYEAQPDGFKPYAQYVPSIEFSRQDKQDLGLRFVDLNADGLQDVIFRRDEKIDGEEKVKTAGFCINGAGKWTCKSVEKVKDGEVPAGELFPPVPLSADFMTGSGSQLVDVDGDGYIDLLYGFSRQGQADAIGSTRRLFRNVAGADGGRKWEEDKGALAPPLIFAIENTGETGVRFTDLNGDGRIDILQAQTVDGVFSGRAFLNDGEKWVPADNYIPPLPFVVRGQRVKAVGYPPGVPPPPASIVGIDPYSTDLFTEVVDVDGDRLPDIVARYVYPEPGDEVEAVYINTGSGWRLDTSIAVPVVLDELRRDAKHLHQWADVNGDGLSDIVVSNGSDAAQTQTFLSTGAGWVERKNWAVPQVALATTVGDPGFRLIDVNGDGLLDVLFSRKEKGKPDLTRGLYLNNGSGWLPVDVAANPIAVPNVPFILEDGLDSGARLVDVDGNGLVDVVRSFNSGGPAGPDQRTAFLNTAARSDVLSSITNGFGVRTELEYRSLIEPGLMMTGACSQTYSSNAGVSDPAVSRPFYSPGTPARYPIISPVPATYAVRRITVDEGNSRKVSNSFCYGGFRVDGLAMRPLGVEWRESVNEETRLITREVAEQDVIMHGMPKSDTTWWLNDSGVAIKLNTSDNAWQLITQAHSIPTGPDRKTYLLQLASTRSQSYELDGQSIGQQTDSYQYDDLMNVMRSDLVRSDGTGITTWNSYENWIGPDRWLLSRLMCSVVVKLGDEGQTETRAAKFAYDSTTGFLSKEISNAWPQKVGDGFACRDEENVRSLTIAYQRDRFGNVVQSSSLADGERPRITRTEYDALGRFAISEINPAGQALTKAVDPATGQTRRGTGPNDVSSRYDYDAFGRGVTDTSPTGVNTVTKRLFPAEVNPALLTGLAVDVAVVERSQTGALPETYTLFDRRGRVIRTIGQAWNGKWVFKDSCYDKIGREVLTSLPYYSGSMPLFAKTGYDVLGRVNTTVSPDGAATATRYKARVSGGGQLALFEDPLKRVTASETNLRKLPVSVIDAKGGKVVYSYDAGDRLKKTVGATGAVTQHRYDNEGHRIATNDPDMGNWEYRYNVFGDLIWQKDARNEISTVEYDVLGRPIRKVQGDGVATWEYDTAQFGIGKLAAMRGSDGYREEYVYDRQGRRVRWVVGVGEDTFTTSTVLDDLGRISMIYYPTGLVVENNYDARGFLTAVRDQQTKEPFWEASAIDELGRTTKERFGNGAVTTRNFNAKTGRLETVRSGTSDAKPANILDLQLSYDRIGNLKQRTEATEKISEDFTYDELDRLTSLGKPATKPGQPRKTTATYDFDAAGRMTFKSDVGTYSYAGAGPFHAVKATTNGPNAVNFAYDANGNLVSGDSIAYEYTSENRLKLIYSDADDWSRFDYSPSGDRYRQTERRDTDTIETLYLGATERIVEHHGPLTGKLVRNRHYLLNASGVFAAVETSTEYASSSLPMHLLGPANFKNLRDGAGPVKLAGGGENETVDVSDYFNTRQTRKVWYLHKDHLGSILRITDEKSRTTARYWYDPWGLRTQDKINDAPGANPGGKLATSWERGFTGHEHVKVASAALIHMGGRVYDPIRASFLSPDVLVPKDLITQALNRFSYVSNNPLAWIDPTGHFRIPIVSDLVDKGGELLGSVGRGIGHFVNEAGKWFSENWRTVVIVAVAVVVTVACYGTCAPVVAGMLAGAATGAASAALYGGSTSDILAGAAKGAIIGAVSAGLFQGVGDAFSGGAGSIGSPDSLGAIIGHGVVGGAMETAQEGDFWRGFAVGAFTKFSSAYGPEFESTWANTARAAVVGGTVAEISGGKFANGAITGIFSYMFNDLAHKIRYKTFVEGFARYVSRVGGSMDISEGQIEEIGITDMMVNADGKLTQIGLSVASGDGDYLIKDEFSFKTTTPNSRLLVGNVTAKVSGRLSVTEGRYYFAGTVSFKPDLYNFNASTHRSAGQELLTTFGRTVGGRRYDINILGSRQDAFQGYYGP